MHNRPLEKMRKTSNAAGGSEKMSKSKGNEIRGERAAQTPCAETLRFFLLATHYRRPIDFSNDRLLEIRRGLESFYRSSSVSSASRRPASTRSRPRENGSLRAGQAAPR